MQDLWAALCLVLVIEGLVLLAMPDAWKKTVVMLASLPVALLRRSGAAIAAVGLLALLLVRGQLG